jgi:hypothetical protein
VLAANLPGWAYGVATVVGIVGSLAIVLRRYQTIDG